MLFQGVECLTSYFVEPLLDFCGFSRMEVARTIFLYNRSSEGRHVLSLV